MIKYKYYNIYLDLKQKINDGIFKKGELLPSENSLADQYETSRETIRKALDYLEQDGLIHKEHGKGSIVQESKTFDFPVSGLISFKELAQAQNIPTRTHLIRKELVTADRDLQKKLQIPPNTKILICERIREIDDQKIILNYDYLDYQFVGDVPDEELEHSLYRYLEQDLGLKISFADKKLSIETATPKDRELLDLRPEDNHLVVVRSHVYLEDARYFQFSESRHRVDKFQFSDFSRRQHYSLKERIF